MKNTFRLIIFVISVTLVNLTLAVPINNPCNIPGQVPGNLTNHKNSACTWASSPSFYIPATGKLYCRTVFIYQESGIYNVDLEWNGTAFDLLDHWAVGTVHWPDR
jgi:hypothetical protein